MEIDAEPPGFTILTSPPIFDHLFSYCAAGTLQRIARTCRSAHEAVSDYLKHALSAQYSQQLSRFFPNPSDLLAFRQLQADLQFLVSGSQALQLLSRTIFADTDLDLYVWPHQAKEVAEWLLTRGYTHAPYVEGRTLDDELQHMTGLVEQLTGHEREYGLDGVRGILNFRKQQRGAENEEHAIEIQIIAAQSSPLHTILFFHATMVMNFISWDRVVSLYPRATFERREALVTFSGASGFDKAMLKYGRRGYRIHHSVFTQDLSSLPFPFTARWVGDGKTWTVPLDTTDLTTPVPTSRWIPEVNSWTLRTNRDSTAQEPLPCRIYVETVRSVIFRFRYCATKGFLNHILPRLITLGRYEARRLEEEGLDPSYGSKGRGNHSFWDHQLILYKDDYIKNLRHLKNPSLNLYRLPRSPPPEDEMELD